VVSSGALFLGWVTAGVGNYPPAFAGWELIGPLFASLRGAVLEAGGRQCYTGVSDHNYKTGVTPLAESKQEETFRVIDRRLFSEDGELRKDVAEQVEREAAATKKPASQSKAAGAGAKSAAGAPTLVPGVGGSTTTEEAAATTEEIPPSRGFQMLVDFLTRNAAAMLGGMADPRTGKPFVDIEGAREMIDMLDALRDTTRGNLAKSDEDLLIEVIGSLKLTFMELSKAATDAMTKKAKGK
jgi:Domain of unknown function (DUF1844)